MIADNQAKFQVLIVCQKLELLRKPKNACKENFFLNKSTNFILNLLGSYGETSESLFVSPWPQGDRMG